MIGTDFPESVKLEARKRAAFKCCYCRERMGDEVHHLEPEELGGQGEIENAILLCAQCHNDYGSNPLKRKQLRQARDDWYEIVASRYSRAEIDQIEQFATKKDIGQIAVELRRLTGIIEASLRTGAISSLDAVNVVSTMTSLAAPSRFMATQQLIIHAESAINPVQISGSNVHDVHIYSSLEKPAPASETERRQLIGRWRKMVMTINKQTRMKKNASRSVTSLLEMNPDFLTLKPYLSERSKDSVYGRTTIVPPDQSEMSGALWALLDDIERLERSWGLAH